MNTQLTLCPSCHTMKHLPEGSPVCARCQADRHEGRTILRVALFLIAGGLVMWVVGGWGVYKMIF